MEIKRDIRGRFTKGYHSGNRLGITLSTTTKAKMSEARRCWHRLHTHPLLGKHHSKEVKTKMSLAQTGNLNANWKDGATKRIRRLYATYAMQQWRKAVLGRDNYTCQDCGTTDNIEAHHIQSATEYPELIYNIDNGLALCKDCHKRLTIWQWFRRKQQWQKRKTKRGAKPPFQGAEATASTSF